MKITIYNKLKKYESFLTTAHYGDYIRSLTNMQLEELITIGAELGIKHVNNHCPKCTLNFVKRLAEPYFQQKLKLEEKQNEKQRQKTNENGSTQTLDS